MSWSAWEEATTNPYDITGLDTGDYIVQSRDVNSVGNGYASDSSAEVSITGTSFTPADITNSAWWDADDAATYTVTSSPDVDDWTSKGDFNLTVSQSTAAAKPHLDSGFISGDGSDDVLGASDHLWGTGDLALASEAGICMYALIRGPASTNQFFAAMRHASSSNHFVGWNKASAGSGDGFAVFWRTFDGDTVLDSSTEQDTGVFDDTWRVLGMELEINGGSSVLNIWDGSSLVSGTIDSTANIEATTLQTFSLFAEYDTAGGNFAEVDIAQIVFVRAASLSSGDRTNLVNFLNAKKDILDPP